MPQLIVLTGPSHSGKSLIARSLLAQLGGALYIAIDEIVEQSGLTGLEDWEGRLPVAYETALTRIKAALRDGASVVFESTFTFIPLDGRPPEFHNDQLARLEGVARDCRASFVLVRVTAELSELLRRREATGRLDARVVEGTWHQHRDAYVWPRALVTLSTDRLQPAAAAQRIVEALQRRQASVTT